MRISDWSSDVCSSDLDGKSAHVPTARGLLRSQCQQLANFGQRETALLCLTNEADALQGLRPVEPVAGVALRIRHDQPFLLVVAQGLGAYGGEAGQFADREHDDLDGDGQFKEISGDRPRSLSTTPRLVTHRLRGPIGRKSTRLNSSH